MTYNVFCKNKICGTVNIFREQLLTVIELDSDIVSSVSRLVYRNGGDIFPIGVPVPRDGRLFLKKKFAHFCPGRTGGGFYELVSIKHKTEECVSEKTELTPDVPEGWMPEYDPARLFKHDGLKRACGNIKRAYTFEDAGRLFLAVPVYLSEPFPLAAYLLFGTPYKTHGGYYMVFALKNGAAAGIS